MPAVELTDEQIFKLLCIEIIESVGIRTRSPIDILDNIGLGDLANWCEEYIFIRDDGELDAGEQFLLDWVRKNQRDWDLVKKLEPIARGLNSKLRPKPQNDQEDK